MSLFSLGLHRKSDIALSRFRFFINLRDCADLSRFVPVYTKAKLSRAMSSNQPPVQPPISEGEVVFQRKPYPSFWSRLAQQKHGLGVMALSASCCFLALSIIKQEKELNRVNDVASQLRVHNDALRARLDNVKLAVQEEGAAGQGLGRRLKDLLQINVETIPVRDDPKEELKNDIKKSIKGKFMV